MALAPSECSVRPALEPGTHRFNHRLWRVTSTPSVVTALIVALSCLSGCTSSSPDLPRDRLGGLPYPGLLTLYDTVDVEKLGRHRYASTPRWFQADDETERGILYTTRAGFLDLAHIRITIDRARYCVREVRQALDRRQSEIVLEGADNTQFIVSLNYPDDWTDLPEARREELVQEASMRVGQQVAYQMVVWHEVITWFGYRTVFFISESRSSFSYEDTMSHVVGLRVCDAALRSGNRDFDDAVTAALSKELRSLGARTPAQTDAAARAVEGVWWSGGEPLKRHLDIGIVDGVVYPWLVPGLPFAEDTVPEPFALPSLKDVRGRDLTGLYQVKLDPKFRQADKIRQHLPGRPTLLEADRDFPILMTVLRTQMQAQHGLAVAEPWNDAAGRRLRNPADAATATEVALPDPLSDQPTSPEADMATPAAYRPNGDSPDKLAGHPPAGD